MALRRIRTGPERRLVADRKLRREMAEIRRTAVAAWAAEREASMPKQSTDEFSTSDINRAIREESDRRREAETDPGTDMETTEEVPAEIVGWQGMGELVVSAVNDLIHEADPAAAQVRILASILTAETTEAMVPDSSALGIHNMCKAAPGNEIGPYVVLGFSVNPGDFEAGLPIYLVIDAVDVASGERVTLQTGSVQTVLSLKRLRDKGRLPVALSWKLAEEKTKAGFRPINMRLVDAHPLDNEAIRERVQ
jgi:hypothetical protein